jgi:glycosyltransferase involved in cell wall biosynthesis
MVGYTKKEEKAVKKIKVMRVITRLNIGGPSIHAVLLTRGLDPDVFETVLVTGQLGKDEGDMGYLAEEVGIRPIIIPTLGREINIASDVVSFVRILRLIIAERPDIIHTHLAKAGTLGRIAGGLVKFVLIFCNKKIKIFHTYHGHYFYGYFGPAKTRVFIYIERALALVCQKIIIISRRLKDDIVRTYRIIPEKKAAVIPLGFDFDTFTTNGSGPRRFRREIGVGPGEKLVGIVGRLTTIKNHDLFLEAAARCLADDTMPPVRFVVVGDGELRSELELKARELKIARRVTFTGWRRDMDEVYAGLDALMITSINEGTPVTIIEAMALGIPVVATAVGGIPDLIGGEPEGLPKTCERGIMVASGDAAGLVEGLRLILTDNDMTESIVHRAREFARSRYDVKRLIKDIESLYLSVLGRP